MCVLVEMQRDLMPTLLKVGEDALAGPDAHRGERRLHLHRHLPAVLFRDGGEHLQIRDVPAEERLPVVIGAGSRLSALRISAHELAWRRSHRLHVDADAKKQRRVGFSGR